MTIFRCPNREIGELPNTDRIMESAFWVGLFPGLTEKMLGYTVAKIREFCRLN